jgi:N-acyl-D-amino-acid deacylase
VHASHLSGPPAAIEAAFRTADAAGVHVSYDMYPYRRSSTTLAMLLLPAELQAGGPELTLAALAEPAQRAELLAGDRLTDDYLQNLYLGCLPARFAELAGKSVVAAAEDCGELAGPWVLDLLLRTRLEVGAQLDRLSLTDEHIAWLARGDRHSAGSDGIYLGQHPHPRGYGAFARLAGYYLTDGHDAGYQQLARHLAANSADAYGLKDRGRVAAGKAPISVSSGRAGSLIAPPTRRPGKRRPE